MSDARRHALRTLNLAATLGMINPKVAPLGGWGGYGIAWRTGRTKLTGKAKARARRCKWRHANIDQDNNPQGSTYRRKLKRVGFYRVGTLFRP